jgi:hypothetical protein
MPATAISEVERNLSLNCYQPGFQQEADGSLSGPHLDTSLVVAAVAGAVAATVMWMVNNAGNTKKGRPGFLSDDQRALRESQLAKDKIHPGTVSELLATRSRLLSQTKAI